MEDTLRIENAGYFISSDYIKEERSNPRLTKCFEIELYTTNNGISVIDGRDYPHSKGNLLIIKPNQLRRSISSFECHYIHFNSLDDVFTKKYLNKLPQFINIFDFNKFSDIFNTLTDAITNKQKGYELFSIAKLLELISELYNISETSISVGNEYSQFEFNIYMATKFIKKNFDRRLALDEIAKSANLSPSYFHLVFKKIIGLTPYKYLLGIRLKTAEKLLLNSNKSLSDIAVACGFDSQAYFNYVFKKELDVTPKHYREIKKVIL